MNHHPRLKELHKETQRPMAIPLDEKDWPEDWKVVEYKTYPRFLTTKLPEADLIELSLSGVLKKRKSCRFFSTQPISLGVISNFLYWSAGRKKEGDPENDTRFYPSGGGRYSLEVYMLADKVVGVNKGVYHYNVLDHSLERVGDAVLAEELRSIQFYEFAKQASAIFFISSIFNRSARKYKERAYRFNNLEAGIVLENMYLVGAGLGLGVCAIGSIFDKQVEVALDMETRDEFYLVACALGVPSFS